MPASAWVPHIRQMMISLSESESRNFEISESQRRSESDMKTDIYRHLRDGCIQQMKHALNGLKAALEVFSKRERERGRPSALAAISGEGVKDLWGLCSKFTESARSVDVFSYSHETMASLASLSSMAVSLANCHFVQGALSTVQMIQGDVRVWADALRSAIATILSLANHLLLVSASGSLQIALTAPFPVCLLIRALSHSLVLLVTVISSIYTHSVTLD